MFLFNIKVYCKENVCFKTRNTFHPSEIRNTIELQQLSNTQKYFFYIENIISSREKNIAYK